MHGCVEPEQAGLGQLLRKTASESEAPTRHSEPQGGVGRWGCLDASVKELHVAMLVRTKYRGGMCIRSSVPVLCPLLGVQKLKTVKVLWTCDGDKSTYRIIQHSVWQIDLASRLTLLHAACPRVPPHTCTFVHGAKCAVTVADWAASWPNEDLYPDVLRSFGNIVPPSRSRL